MTHRVTVVLSELRDALEYVSSGAHGHQASLDSDGKFRAVPN